MIFKSDEERKAAYFAAFNSSLTRRVLADIADRLGFWNMQQMSNLSPEAQVAMMYVAKQILSDAGVWKEIYNNTILLKRAKQRRFNWLKRLFERKRK